MLALVFDTETTGMVNFKEDADHASQPWPVEIGWRLVNTEKWSVCQSFVSIIRVPATIDFEDDAVKIHGITAEMSTRLGADPVAVFDLFASMVQKADILVCHSWDYDRRVMTTLGRRLGVQDYELKTAPHLCTMKVSTPLCKLPKPGGRAGYKWPTLAEAYRWASGEDFDDSHTALADVRATTTVFRHLIEAGHLPSTLEGIAKAAERLDKRF